MHRLVLLRHFGLALEFFQTAIELTQNVFHPGQIGAGVGEAVFSFAPPLFVFRYARGFFQEKTQFFRFGFNNAADRALADDGVGAWAQAGAQKYVLYVAPAHCLVIYEVTGRAVARQHPAHRYFGKLAPLAARAVIGIVKHQLDTRPAGGLARRGAVKDDILHGLATQFTGTAFAQNPAHGVHDVGLSAAVGAHHPHQLARQQEVGRFDKGLKTRQLDGIEAHG